MVGTTYYYSPSQLNFVHEKEWTLIRILPFPKFPLSSAQQSDLPFCRTFMFLICITADRVLQLTDEHITGMNCTPATRTRIRGFHSLLQLFRPDSSTLERIRAEVTCPIAWTVAKDPVVSPCCGRVFSRRMINQYHASAMTSLTPACPCCGLPSNTSWVLNQATNSAPKNIANAVALPDKDIVCPTGP